jgi:hypothetical protein
VTASELGVYTYELAIRCCCEPSTTGAAVQDFTNVVVDAVAALVVELDGAAVVVVVVVDAALVEVVEVVEVLGVVVVVVVVTEPDPLPPDEARTATALTGSV